MLNHDSGVYYTAGYALAHGRLPYRDFLFLQPPAVMLTTASFAEFGAWTRDELSFVAANLAFMCLGAANAGVVVIAGRRLGLPESAARVGGIAYAVWIGAAGAEASVRLEPLGALLFLCCLVFTAPEVRTRSAGSALVGGVFGRYRVHGEDLVARAGVAAIDACWRSRSISRPSCSASG